MVLNVIPACVKIKHTTNQILNPDLVTINLKCMKLICRFNRYQMEDTKQMNKYANKQNKCTLAVLNRFCILSTRLLVGIAALGQT